MTILELEIALSELYPTKYDHFEDELPLPSLVYQVPETTSMSANGKVVRKIHSVRLELYTAEMDNEKENAVENKLQALKIRFSQAGREYISSESFHQTIYIFDIMEVMSI